MLLVAVAAALTGGIAAAAARTPDRQAGRLAVNADPPTPSNFVGITPVRVLDTREPTGVPTAGPIPPDTSINVDVAGVSGIPANATSVAANVAIDVAQAGSFITMWPTGQPRPLVAANNALVGAVSASAGIFQLGTNGQLSVYNSSSPVNVIVDVTGYYVPVDPILWAVVQFDGTLIRDNGHVVSAAVLPGSGNPSYVVTFDRDVSDCAYLVTAGSGPELIPPVARVSEPSPNSPNQVGVQFIRSNNSATFSGFHLGVIC